VEIHFISVKIRVVWGTNTWVESECLVWKNPDSVRHYGHSVQRGLAVEENDIAVSYVALDNEAWLNCFSQTFPFSDEFQADPSSVWPNDVQSSWVLVWSVPDQVSQFLDVPRRDPFWNG
jgi:hypothetical protein